MLKRGPTINRSSIFNDSVRDLDAQCVQGVQAAVDHFIEGLRAGGESLAIRSVDESGVHHVDNPTLGNRGLGYFGIQLVKKTRDDGSIIFTLIDIWIRTPGLSDPS
jgi:hypothetical protein